MNVQGVLVREGTMRAGFQGSATETVMGYIGLLLIGLIGWACDRLSKGADTERLEESRGQVGSGRDTRRTAASSVGKPLRPRGRGI
jgi:hypothetical protein